MCGRYYIDQETLNKSQSLLAMDHSHIQLPASGDIHPSETALVYLGRQGRLALQSMGWGFPQQNQSGLLINARAESVLEKITFRDSVLHRRCAVLAGHYYEWNRSREKVTFKRTDRTPMYMAGIYRLVENEFRYIILTTAANSSVQMIHHRMPLILEKTDVEKWVFDDEYMRYLLQKTPIPLDREQEYEQQCMQLG